MPLIEDVNFKERKIKTKTHNGRDMQSLNPKVESELDDSKEDLTISIENNPGVTAFKKISYRPWDSEEPEIKTTQIEINNKADSILLNNKETNRLVETTFNGDKSDKLKRNDLEMEVASIIGVQRNILFFIIKELSSYEEESFFYTKPIYLMDISNHTKASILTVKTSLARMKQKNIVESVHHKTGRGGFVSFRVRKDLVEILKLLLPH